MFDPAPLTIFILAALALLFMLGPAVLYIKYPTYLATGTV